MSSFNKQVKSTCCLLSSLICNWWYKGALGFCCREAEPCINVNDCVCVYTCTLHHLHHALCTLHLSASYTLYSLMLCTPLPPAALCNIYPLHSALSSPCTLYIFCITLHPLLFILYPPHHISYTPAPYTPWTLHLSASYTHLRTERWLVASLTPFQILSFIEPLYCTLGLLITKVSKALTHHVPKSSASS